MNMEPIVTADYYVEGCRVVEVGGDFEDSFSSQDVVPPGFTSPPLSGMMWGQRPQLSDRLVDEAVRRAMVIAARNGWNAVLNFRVDFSRFGGWGPVSTVRVHLRGTLCTLVPT